MMNHLGPGRRYLLENIPELKNFVSDEEVLPFLEIEGMDRKKLTIEALLGVLHLAAQDSPLLLLVSGLHRAGSPTREILYHLAKRIGNIPIMVIITINPDGLPRDSRIPDFMENLLAESSCQEILLVGLSPRETQKLLGSYLGLSRSHSRYLAKEIHGVTQGNPLFLNEFLHLVYQEGTLRWDGEKWLLEHAELPRLTIPEHVKQVIGGRLDSLSEVDRHIIRTAAVAGREFSPHMLHRLTGLDTGTVRESLNLLKKLKIIGERFSHDSELLSFSNRLTRQILSEEIPQEEKREIHRLMANYLEAQSESEVGINSGKIAKHSFAAGDMDRAITYYEKAALRAERIFALEEAIGFYSTLGGLQKELGDSPSFRQSELRRAILMSKIGEYDRAGIILRNLLDETSSNDLLRGQILSVQAKVLSLSGGGSAEAGRMLDRAICLFEKQNQTEEMITAYIRKASLCRKTSRYADGIKICVEMLEKAGTFRNPPSTALVAWLHSTRADLHFLAGNYSDAQLDYERSLELLRGSGNINIFTMVYNNLTSIHLAKGEIDRAIAYQQESLALAEQMGDRRKIAQGSANLSSAYRQKHDYDRAFEYIGKSLELSRELGDPRLIASCHTAMGNLYISRNDFPRARECYLKALSLREEEHNEAGIASAANNLGEVLFKIGELEEAKHHLLKSLRIRKRIGDRRGPATAYFNLSNLCQRSGALNRARILIEACLSIFESLGTVQPVIDCYQKLADIHTDMGEGDTALEFLKKAGELGETTGIHPAGDANGLRIRGKILALKGNDDEAMEAFHASIRIYKNADAVYELGVCYREMGAVMAEKSSAGGKKLSTLLKCLEKARYIFLDLGASNELEQTQHLIKKLEKLP